MDGSSIVSESPSALATTSAFADVVKIGLLAPITGPAAADGQEFQRGVQMAIDEANAAGGVAGNTFELVVGDVKDQSAGNVTAAFDAIEVERLVRWAQANPVDYSYVAFSEKAKAAGCAGYLVSFPGRRVVYFGRTAETHVEHFPK